jgi:hypothetical protein
MTLERSHSKKFMDGAAFKRAFLSALVVHSKAVLRDDVTN